MKKIFNKIVKSWNKFWFTPMDPDKHEWFYIITDILLYGINPTSYTINKLKH